MLMLLLVAMMVVTVLVMVVVVVMVIIARFVVMIVFDVHVEPGPVDARLLSARGVDMEFVEAKFFQFVLQLAQVHAEVKHRADKHVAADPAEHIQVKRLHSNSPATSALIWLAANPAPNPLLMFTTVRPLPQLFSIANNAASPPKLVP